MSSSLRRGTLAATVLALSVATLTACGAGNNAETLQVRPDSAAASVGDIQVQAVTVITSGEGSGPAAVTARIFNAGDKDETLESIRLPGSGTRVRLSPAKGQPSLAVPAGGHLAIGGKGNASAAIAEAGESLRTGGAVPVTFDLSETGKVKLRATVMPAGHDGFAKFGPSAQPTRTPGEGEATPTGSPTGSPAPTEGARGGEQPDGTAPGGEATASAPADGAGGADHAGEADTDGSGGAGH